MHCNVEETPEKGGRPGGLPSPTHNTFLVSVQLVSKILFFLLTKSFNLCLSRAEFIVSRGKIKDGEDIFWPLKPTCQEGMKNGWNKV